MKKIVLIAALLIMSISIAACGNNNEHNKDNISEKNKMKIFTTTFAFQSITSQIGGKYAEVKSIYPAGADIHSYEPTQKDMLQIAKGDLFIYSSNKMDPVAGKIAKSINNKEMKLPLAESLKSSQLLKADEDEHSEYDPHIWLDPVVERTFAKEIKNKLIAQDPKHRSYYEDNYKKVDKDLEHINEQLVKATKHAKRHKVIISHDSLGYLAKRYDFEQEGVNGMNDEEPSQKKVLSIVHDIKDAKMPYVLYEQNISSKVTDVIKKETNTEPLSFHNMATLTKEEQNQDITYQSLMKKNIRSLQQALND
ncbi:zinc ABC transporter substrate-binding protein [Staphylococcus simiae]|uniref:metal ABC transporter solute-binding protein, Zn/Mn family n=1 Tax=Staphylococcus simiae TaxID=308354 RepID=UPI001A977FC1|nr:zinc ABC transporter substrate-binding protein [Staphylococcus simiae]MBO1198133.1 zinc ABC transporter substrate-binding protein [Staphylococcus simiae]MBO1200323.1 zinc ABC transporter substrate-binding protein [Staphylococcus simiae]MBO1202513.1 zinc ABC transporter substrate-binding protein [Staphylococcus simiae]MBO1210209.1 zinc ABC transporter substrate-binding protein [Staphylococcus simiae]MBO1228657.1 zinc ABC transporter substrate-binding protein [Staphylococcus simiae]